MEKSELSNWIPVIDDDEECHESSTESELELAECFIDVPSDEDAMLYFL